MIMSNVLASFKAKLQKMDKDFKTASVLHLKIGVRRKLTAGEIQMCQLVFKNSIDYSKVLINIGGYIHSKTGNAMSPAGEIVLSRNEYINNPDFSLSRPSLKHWFIHEMTHIWQYQNGTKTAWLGLKQLCSGGYTTEVQSIDSGIELEAYDTDLTGRDYNKKFQEFNFEQQGRIIEFYFDNNFLKNDEPYRAHLQISKKLGNITARILTDFLKNPSDKMLLPRN